MPRGRRYKKLPPRAKRPATKFAAPTSRAIVYGITRDNARERREESES